MSPVSIQTLAFIFYCSPVQGKMAGASISVYEFGRYHHVYKSVWTPLNDKTCKCILQKDNEPDQYAIND